MTSSRLVTVYWRANDDKEAQERIKVEFDPSTFAFAVLDTWARSRFGVPAETKLKYLREGLETEFVPDVEWLSSKDQENASVMIASIEKKATPSLVKKASSDGASPIFAFTCCALCALVAVMGAFPEKTQNYGLVLWRLFEVVDDDLINAKVIAKSGCAKEAFIAMICWSTTNLFVRRLFNPETTETAFRKYSADAFFGGIAAAAAIVLKYHLQSRLSL